MPGKHDIKGHRIMADVDGSASSVEPPSTPVMALTKNMKAGTAGKDARRAASEGHWVFLYKLDMPNLDPPASSTVNEATEIIEVIEREGWAMSQMAVYADLQHWSLVMLFRPDTG